MSLQSYMTGSGFELTTLRLAALLVIAAIGYAASSYGLKLYATVPNLFGMSLICGGLVIAILAEVILLQRMDLSTGYIFIIALETVLVLLAALSLGETLDARKMIGASLVIAGLFFVH